MPALYLKLINQSTNPQFLWSIHLFKVELDLQGNLYDLVWKPGNFSLSFHDCILCDSSLFLIMECHIKIQWNKTNAQEKERWGGWGRNVVVEHVSLGFDPQNYKLLNTFNSVDLKILFLYSSLWSRRFVYFSVETWTSFYPEELFRTYEINNQEKLRYF